MVLLARLIKLHFPIVDILLHVRLIEVTPFFSIVALLQVLLIGHPSLLSLFWVCNGVLLLYSGCVLISVTLQFSRGH